jgi:4-amino-4-deoxy-L-arabinose transferase-like glycosyltransferase
MRTGSSSAHNDNRSVRLIVLLTLIAFVLRIWQFGAYPPGLNPDEASIGYESYAILHAGIDRNGTPYPVHLIAWGSGQNVLYAYAAMPFIGALGLTAFSTRLPMLFVGVLSIPLLWYVARATFGKRVAEMAALFLCLSPWHIMLSRWALESNLLVFTFLLAYAMLLRALRRPGWLIGACGMFALSLYAYGTAYLAIAVFALGALFILWKTLRPTLRVLLISGSLFALLAAPIAVFVLLNTFKLVPNTVMLGPIGIPRMPSAPRYETITLFFHADGWAQIKANAGRLATLLWAQDDTLIWNALPGIGFAYGPISLMLAGVGLIFGLRQRHKHAVQLLFLWTLIGLLVGVVQEPNINRINILLLPLHLWAAVTVGTLLAWLWSRWVVALALTTACAVFLNAYFVEDQAKIAEQFFDGLPQSLALATQLPGERVCVTDQANMPYIYVLFAERTDPHVFVQTVKYADPSVAFRNVNAFGRYTFGVQNCDSSYAVFVLRHREALPAGAHVQTIASYADFAVYRSQ